MPDDKSLPAFMQGFGIATGIAAVMIETIGVNTVAMAAFAIVAITLSYGLEKRMDRQAANAGESE